LTAPDNSSSVSPLGFGPDKIEVSGMSNQKTGKKRVTFSYAEPAAQSVLLAGDFTGWQQAPLSLKRDKNGVWKKIVSLAPGQYQYRLLVDGEWRNDPKCAHRQANQFGGENCVCIVDGV
jgi:1,4-alpha-glucan branching enzyme